MSEEIAWPDLVVIDLRSQTALSEEGAEGDEIYASALDVPALLTEVKRLRTELGETSDHELALAGAQREDGSHRYLSTSCLHGDHGHCGGALNHEGEAKVPTACKRCDSTCVCPCHKEVSTNGE